MNGKEIRLITLLVIDTIFFLIEIIVGYAVGSLALVADSFHMLNDILSLFIALWAIKVATKPKSEKNSYGWQRAEILGALLNGTFLLALCFSIFLEAIERFFNINEISNAKLVVIVGALGLASNIVGLFLFHDHSHAGHSHGHSHDEEETYTPPMISQAPPNVSPPGSTVGPLPTADAHKRARSKSAHPRSKDRSESFGSLYAHPAETRAQIIETAHEFQRSGSVAFSPRDDSPISQPAAAMIHNHGVGQGHGRSGQSVDRLIKRSGSIEPTSGYKTFSPAPEAHSHSHDHDHDHEGHDHAAHAHNHKHDHPHPHTHSHGAASGNESDKSQMSHSHSEAEQGGHAGHKHDHDHDHHDHDHDHDHDHSGHSHGAASGGGSGGHSHGHGSMNMKGVFLHVLGDALGNIGVIAAGLVIVFGHGQWKYYFDPAISLVITIIIFSSALPLVKSASYILLQGVPTHISLEEVRTSIRDVDGVLSLHELHIWQLSETTVVASVHVLVARTADVMVVSDRIRQALHEHGVHSSTIQPEFGEEGVENYSDDEETACLIRCPPDSCGGDACCPPVGQLVDVEGNEVELNGSATPRPK